jgi:hypothetical protein
MRVKLSICILIFQTLLVSAYGAVYSDLIRKTKIYLVTYPGDTLERLNLAYYYMMTSQPDSAYVNYQTLLHNDPQNADAASGVLWSLNALKLYKKSATNADSLLLAFPKNPNILYHRAIAMQNTYRPIAAGCDFLSAWKLSEPGSDIHNLASLGAAWNYWFLGDSAKSNYWLRKRMLQPDPVLLEKIRRIRSEFSAGFGFKDSGDSYYFGSASVHRNTISATLQAEEYEVDTKHFRTAFRAEVSKQYTALDVKVGGQYLLGVDTRVYPAWQTSISLIGKINPSAFQIKPLLTASYTYYPRFSCLQADIGCWAGNDMLKVLLMYSGLYKDNEPADSDSLEHILTGSFSVRIYHNLRLALTVNRGNMNWWTNQYGTVLDTFEANNTNLGIGAYIPLGNWISLSLYQQFGFLDEKINYLTQGSLAISF